MYEVLLYQWERRLFKVESVWAGRNADIGDAVKIRRLPGGND